MAKAVKTCPKEMVILFFGEKVTLKKFFFQAVSSMKLEITAQKKDNSPKSFIR